MLKYINYVQWLYILLIGGTLVLRNPADIKFAYMLLKLMETSHIGLSDIYLIIQIVWYMHGFYQSWNCMHAYDSLTELIMQGGYQ